MNISKIIINSKFIKYAYIGNSILWAKPWISTEFFSSNFGAWFDLNDISTLYQDAAGSIPVMTFGDPIGLILDKSKNLELGPELYTNSDFSTNDLSHITSDNNNTAEIINNKLRLTRVNDGYFIGTITITGTIPNKWYRLEIQGNAIIGNDPIHTTSVPYNVFYKENSDMGIYYFKSTQNYIRVEVGTLSYGETSVIEISKLSVKEFKGNHASQKISASRPIYKKVGNKVGFEIDRIDDTMEIAFPQRLKGNMSVSSDSGILTKPIDIPANSPYNLLSQYASSTFINEIIIRNTPYTNLEKYIVESHLSGK